MLDGEIVALDAKGEPAGFQQLQGRIHLSGSDAASPPDPPDPPGRSSRVALIAFDILRDGRTDFRDRPLVERRAALEKVFGRTGSPVLRISDQVSGDGRALYKAGARSRMGRADRQARRLAVQVGQAVARLAQAEDRPRAGVRHRRLDRAAADARVLRRAAARRVRRTRSRLHGAHRHRLQRERARARDEAAQAARDEDLPVQDEAEDERAAALGPPGARGADQDSRSGRPTASCGIRSISGCATTRRRRRSDEKMLSGFGVQCSASKVLVQRSTRGHARTLNAEPRTNPAP